MRNVEPAARGPESFEDGQWPGAVLMVPNSRWGFKNLSSEDHPGACTALAEDRRSGTMLKGTDAEHVMSVRRFFIVEPTLENGLAKRTAFELSPRWIRLHVLRTYVPDRILGRLSPGTLQSLQAALLRLFPEV